MKLPPKTDRMRAQRLLAQGSTQRSEDDRQFLEEFAGQWLQEKPENNSSLRLYESWQQELAAANQAKQRSDQDALVKTIGQGPIPAGVKDSRVLKGVAVGRMSDEKIKKELLDKSAYAVTERAENALKWTRRGLLGLAIGGGGYMVFKTGEGVKAGIDWLAAAAEAREREAQRLIDDPHNKHRNRLLTDKDGAQQER